MTEAEFLQYGWYNTSCYRFKGITGIRRFKAYQLKKVMSIKMFSFKLFAKLVNHVLFWSIKFSN